MTKEQDKKVADTFKAWLRKYPMRKKVENNAAFDRINDGIKDAARKSNSTS